MMRFWYVVVCIYVCVCSKNSMIVLCIYNPQQVHADDIGIVQGHVLRSHLQQARQNALLDLRDASQRPSKVRYVRLRVCGLRYENLCARKVYLKSRTLKREKPGRLVALVRLEDDECEKRESPGRLLPHYGEFYKNGERCVKRKKRRVNRRKKPTSVPGIEEEDDGDI